MSESPDARVRLVQLLCPRRHCLLAVAYESDQGTRDKAVIEMEAQRVRLGLNPWCGICGSRELAYEDRPTPYRTIEDALPELRETEQANLESRAHLDALGLSYDSQPRN
jgi:hypothetical protein